MSTSWKRMSTRPNTSCASAVEANKELSWCCKCKWKETKSLLRPIFNELCTYLHQRTPVFLPGCSWRRCYVGWWTTSSNSQDDWQLIVIIPHYLKPMTSKSRCQFNEYVFHNFAHLLSELRISVHNYVTVLSTGKYYENDNQIWVASGDKPLSQRDACVRHKTQH